MGVRFPSVFSTTSQAVVPAAGTNTVILTTPPLTLPLDGATVALLWSWNGTVGAGTTSMAVTINRSLSLGINVLATTTQPVTAAANFSMAGIAIDPNPGAVGGVQYTMQMSGTGTTGAFANGNLALFAFAL
jgi:hypothetical protein